MNDIELRASEFEQKLDVMISQRESTVKEFALHLAELYQTMKPIVDMMKRRGLTFGHPHLQTVTKHAPIVGRSKNGDTVTVFDGVRVFSVDIAADELKQPRTVDDYVKTCDYEFASEGLLSLPAQLDSILKGFEQEQANISDIIQKMKA